MEIYNSLTIEKYLNSRIILNFYECMIKNELEMIRVLLLIK
ncbi:hypothetical protein J831_4258 [Acinetobacter baumannii 25691_8]|nr:hypothetical protein J837_3118 [Acinetobacter baumannii 25935_4]KCY90196.1 hypothetical protein J831_4258 [Acinetobacter baumannii 25691_8]